MVNKARKIRLYHTVTSVEIKKKKKSYTLSDLVLILENEGNKKPKHH